MENFEQKILHIMQSENLNNIGREKLYKRFSAKSKIERDALDDALAALERQGSVFLDKSGKRERVILSESAGIVKAKIQANPKGFGFAVPENKDVPDLFIPPDMLGGAYHGDVVLVRRLPSRRRSQSDAAEVIKILSRGYKKVVCRMGMGGAAKPDDQKLFKDILIEPGYFAGAETGDKVLVEITRYGRYPQGRVAEILGKEGQKGVDILSIIRAHNLYEEFPQAVIKEAQRAQKEVTQRDLSSRKDYRNQLIITIDGADAKDLDDAVSVKVLQNGNFLLGVHIADVSHYVREGTWLDREALKRGTSVYFPDRVLPMLPKELSNGICSLNPNADRLTLSLEMEIDSQGKVVKSDIQKGVINSAYRMTYHDVTAILEGDAELCDRYSKIVPMLRDMEKLMHILYQKRRQRGSIDFEIPECKIILDSDGSVADVLPYPRGVSNRIIEEFMLVANQTVAEKFFYLDVPFVFRVHEPPTSEKMIPAIALCQGLGIQIRHKKGQEVTPKTVQQILEQAQDTAAQNVINKVMLRSMQKARYHYENLGHFGLAAEFYCHFTSPIRRYPDLAIHRIISTFLEKGIDALGKYDAFAADAADLSSQRERAAEEAEREVDDLKKAEFMAKQLGMEFEGVVSGVTNFGIFVELPNTCEGLIRLENLPKDRYTYDEERYALIGRKRTYRLGDPMKIIVASANPALQRVEFVPAG